MKRRILSIITVLALCLSLCPTWALAAEGPVASVTTSGDTSTYDTIEAAWTAANENTATITLLTDVTLNENTSLGFSGGNITLDCGGHTLTAKSSGQAIRMYISAGSVIVKNGTVKNEGTVRENGVIAGNGIQVNGGTLTVEPDAGIYGLVTGVAIDSGSAEIKGKVNGGKTGVTIGGNSQTSATVKIDGGDISSDGSDGKGLVVDSGATATLISGIISGGVCAIEKVESATVTVAEGSIATLNGNPLTFHKDEDDPSDTSEYSGPGTVMVEPCTHPGVKATPNAGNPDTHSMTCTYCDLNETAEPCSYGGYESDADDHWQTCMLCGGKKTGKHDKWITSSGNDGNASNVTTNHKKCGTCQYEMAPVTVTVHVPEGLVYGQTGGKKLTCTVEPAQEGGSAVWRWGEYGKDTPEPKPDSTLPDDLPAGNYVAMVEIMKEDNHFYGQAEFTVSQSGTEFDGGVKAYKDNTETNSFLIGDTITVKATPKATGQAPAKAAMMMASLAEPAARQMAVFYQETQVSAPSTVDNGVHTMTVNTNDLPQDAFNKEIPLTVKFVGDGNMASAEASVKVTVKAEAQVTADGAAAYYGTLEAAIAAANKAAENENDTVTITLLADLTGDGQQITIGNQEQRPNLILDGSGHTLENYFFETFTSLTLRNCKANFSSLAVNNEVITLEGSTVISDKFAGTISTLTMDANSEIIGTIQAFHDPQQLTAGTFSSNSGSPILCEDGLGSLLKTDDPNHHYAYYSGSKPILDVLDKTKFEGYTTVTIRECTNHVFAYTHDEGSLTHTKACRACGYSVTEPCDYKFTGKNVGTCICGDKLTVEVDPTPLTYNGIAPKPEVTVKRGNDDLDIFSAYTVSYAGNEAAGDASVTVTIGNDQGTYSTTFTIARATPTIAWSDTSQELTYTGSPAAITPPTVTLVNGEQFSGTFTYSYGTYTGPDLPTNAGTYAVTASIAENGNYTAATTATQLTLTINKADASVTTAPAAVQELTYTGAAQALVTAGTANLGEVVYSLTETGPYSGTIPTGVNAGDYTVWYKVEGTDNYNGTTPASVDVKIDKANYSGATTADTAAKFGAAATYDLTALLPDGSTAGTASTSDGIFEGTPGVSGKILSYKLKADAVVDSTGDITVPVTAANYNDFSLTVTVTVKEKDVPTLSVDPITVTYSGEAVPDNAIKGTARVGDTTVPGVWSFDVGQNLTNVTDSGTKTVMFTPNDSQNYETATASVRVTINRATPELTLTVSPATLTNGGTVTLTLTGLPTGGTATVRCDHENISVTKGTGNTWTAELPAGGASYTFTASCAGDGNHNSAEADCTVRVEKITPSLTLTAAPTSLTGGGTVTLRLTGLPDGGTAAVSCSGGITVTAGAGGTWTATLPNRTGTYTFTASCEGNNVYNAASAICTVTAKEVIILPDPPADDGDTKFQMVMETGISVVPGELAGNPKLDTPEKLETAMKTEISKINSGIPEANTSVYDVSLMVSVDGGTTWTPATTENFPSGGLTVTLPYPAGTDSSYKFTVVHMFTTSDFGKQPGDTETFTPEQVRNTDKGIQVVVTGLSPISVGWVKAEASVTPGSSSTPPGGGSSGGGNGKPGIVPVEKPEQDSVTSRFTDLGGPGTWYYDAVGFVLRNGLMNGYNSSLFGPDDNLSRAQLAQILYNKEGKPVVTGGSGFVDVRDGQWFAPAITWAAGNGIVSGYGDGRFGPDDNITREQLAVMLWRYVGNPAATDKELRFADADKVSGYALEALCWAVENGVMNGKGGGVLDPGGLATRAQTAQMLKNFIEQL